MMASGAPLVKRRKLNHEVKRSRHSLQATDTLTKHRTSFLDLPAELRNEIYRLALKSDEKFYLRNVGTPRIHCALPIREPALLFVSKQVRAEGMDVFYGSNIFNALTEWDAASLLGGVTIDKIPKIRHLEIYLPSLPFYENDKNDWLVKVRDHVNSLAGRFSGIGLRKDALRVGKERPDAYIFWTALGDIPELRIVEEDGAWRVEWAAGYELKIFK